MSYLTCLLILRRCDLNRLRIRTPAKSDFSKNAVSSVTQSYSNRLSPFTWLREGMRIKQHYRYNSFAEIQYLCAAFVSR